MRVWSGPPHVQAAAYVGGGLNTGQQLQRSQQVGLGDGGHALQLARKQHQEAGLHRRFLTQSLRNDGLFVHGDHLLLHANVEADLLAGQAHDTF